MIVAVTGTPGTGKTTAVDLAETDLDAIHLNEIVREEGLYDGVDEERESVVADLEAVRVWLDSRDDVLVDSHLAHRFDADRVIVLRCRPDELERRLRDRGFAEGKARENAESEALDLVLSEAVAEHGTGAVYEIDTTDRPPEGVAREIERVVAGDRDPSAGEVSFEGYL